MNIHDEIQRIFDAARSPRNGALVKPRCQDCEAPAEHGPYCLTHDKRHDEADRS